jgi:riboflavin synthase
MFSIMFTGLITDIGQIASIKREADGLVLSIECPDDFLADTRVGESISVSGVCLTVTRMENRIFFSDISSESVKRTTIPSWRSGRKVNLEKSLRPDGKLGGHFVMGHVDGTAKISGIIKQGETELITFESSPEIIRMVVPKGSVAIDGISLTPTERKNSSFTIAVMPHTLEKTTLANGRVGEEVNVEIDIFARYIFEFLKSTGMVSDKDLQSSSLDIETLRSEGY